MKHGHKTKRKQTHEDEVGREWSLGCIRILLAHIDLVVMPVVCHGSLVENCLNYFIRQKN